jgi:hypothetical protein
MRIDDVWNRIHALTRHHASRNKHYHAEVRGFLVVVTPHASFYTQTILADSTFGRRPEHM